VRHLHIDKSRELARDMCTRLLRRLQGQRKTGFITVAPECQLQGVHPAFSGSVVGRSEDLEKDKVV